MSIINCRAAGRAVGIYLALVCAFGIRLAMAAALDLPTALSQLPTASFEDKSAIIQGLAQSHPKGSRQLLQAMLDGHAAVRESDKKVSS